MKMLSVLTSTVMMASLFTGLSPISSHQVKAEEAIVSNNLKFDFGSSTSPVAEGYTQVTNTMIYSEDRGFGINKSIANRDRGNPDDLRRDFVIDGNYEFKVDVPNGEYLVKILAGDEIAFNRSSFSIEGVSYGSISSSTGNYAELSPNVVVSDGQLNVLIGDNGRINALEVIPMIAPEGLELVDTSVGMESSVSLKWQEADGALGYNIYRTLEGEDDPMKIGSSKSPEFTDTNAQLGYTYQYTVTQIDSGHIESTNSESLTVSVVDSNVDAPGPPSSLSLGQAKENSISFNWDAIDDTVLYYVYRAKAEDGPYSLLATSTKPSFSEDIQTTMNYYYKVSAVNLGGFSELSQQMKTPIANVVARQMEKLNRDLVAVKVDEGVYLSWRLLGNDSENISFNLYREGVKVNQKPVSTSTNFVDTEGTVDASYELREVLNGKENVEDQTEVLSNNYFDIPLQKPEDGTTPDGVDYTYSANDASIGDLDGDGEYEIVLKWDPSNSQDNSKAGYTGNVYIDAYKLDGTLLWRLDLGKNIRAGAHYTQFLVYDFDGDGKSEVVMKTADGTKDGLGNVIGDVDADYRNSGGYVLSGPEFLTIFKGETGKALTSTDYYPPRGNVDSWGDNYGNRVDRFLAGVAYLDGKTPSIIMARGYYTRAVIAAYNFKDGQLTKQWDFDTNKPDNALYAGQGNHSISVADVDGDGKDEIIYGAAAIDHDGSPLHNTGLGHGDAQHVGDLDPNRPGLEIYQVHENKGAEYGMSFRDAETGEIIWGVHTGADTGRGVSSDVDPRYPGAESWAIAGPWDSRVGGVYTTKGEKVSSNIPTSNFAIWWDGDLLRELLDHDFDGSLPSDHPRYGLGAAKIDKWDYKNNKLVNLLSDDKITSSNWTKGNPALQADLLGDWREEAIWRLNDSSALRVYTTTAVTEHRIPTLMHDPQYRLAIAWQNVAYNQPPHPSYFLGHDMDEAPFPTIYTDEVVEAVVKINPQKLNLKSKGGKNSVTVSIELPSNIEGNAKAVRLNVDGKTIFGDLAGKGNSFNNKKLTVKFNRQEIIDTLNGLSGQVNVNLLGYLDSGVTFIGKDSINVIH
ncbi:rhamnogalacturonan lyase family protein [Bacillus sp. FSL K6-3431]|uniref:rhamnogalacturonan lyase family protein n=1 Tax=Bacillus sp. FSL K6-3431 TaxID=2921500 RepID=UPI0030F676FA